MSEAQSGRGRGRRAVWAIGWAATVAVSALLAHEGHAPLPSKGVQVDAAKGRITLSAAARAALDVQSAEIGAAAPVESLPAPAIVVSPWTHHAFATSGVAGRIVRVFARPGQPVAAGDVLAEVQSPEVESLQLSLLNAANDARQARLALEALKGAGGAVAERQVLEADVLHRQSQNALEVARAKWLALGLPTDALGELLAGRAAGVAALPVRSLIGGTVTHAEVAAGKVVEPGEHLFEVVDLSTVWVRIGVLERDIERVAAGQPVELRLTGSTETFRGTVEGVGLALDPVTNENPVWAVFHNPPGAEPRLVPGMTGLARIDLPSAAGVRTVPADALVDNGVDRFVLVEAAKAERSSEYQKRSVAVVRETPSDVEVRSGDLLPGDRVATRGSHELGGFFAPGVLRLTPEMARSIGLRIEPLVPRAVEDVVEVPGAVDLPPERRGVAAAQVGGTLVAVHAGRGQRVRAGDVLAELFSLEFIDLQLELLKEHLAADLAASQLDSVRRGAVDSPRRRLIDLEAAAVAARNRRDSLRRRLAVVGLTDAQLDALVVKRELVPRVPIRATAEGTVVAFDKVLGQTGRADEPFFQVHDLAKPWVQGYVAQGEIGRVRVGQAARVRVVGSGEVLGGTVVRSGRTLDADLRTLSIWVELDGTPSPPLRHGQTARLSLTHGSPPPALAVPLAAVVREGSQAFVFVRKGDGTFERRAVTLGRFDDRFAEVVGEVSAGEPVAVAAAAELQTAHASVR